jgi:hypothetical protein
VIGDDKVKAITAQRRKKLASRHGRAKTARVYKKFNADRAEETLRRVATDGS